MGTVYLGLLLHFYQPPGQTAYWLRRIVNESYRPLIGVFNAHVHARAAFNINGVTSEMLDDHGYGDVLAGLSGLAGTGRVEFVGSGKYHPILPLVAPEEASRQVGINDETNRRLLGEAYQPRGFFPPEMAWDAALTPLVAASGKSWAIMSGIACPSGWPVDEVQRGGPAGELALLFRDDVLSNVISFRSTTAAAFLEDVRRHGADGDRYIMLAMDAETYGHHNPGWEEEFLGTLFALLARDDEFGGDGPWVRMATPSEIVEHFRAGSVVMPRASSWSTTRADLDSGNPYPLWKHRANEIHRLLWRHLDQALDLFDLARDHGHPGGEMDEARSALDSALHSDQFWWASKRPHWGPTLVHRGLNMQRDLILHALRAINLSDAPDAVRAEAQEHVVLARDLADRITDRLSWD